MMAQTSGPLVNQPFTDEQWRDAQGDEAGIKHDIDGTSYSIVLANNSDVASLGSPSQDSISVVGGFPHRIDAGTAQMEGITIPAAVGGARTDLIVLRYDPTWGTAAPGPVRLFRVAGTPGAGVPAYDSTPPGVEDFPLWEITRQPNTALSQASLKDRRVWIGPSLYVGSSDTGSLPQNPPLGTRVQLGFGPNARRYIRVVDDQGTATWQVTSNGRQTGAFTYDPAYQNQAGQGAAGVYSEGGRVYLTGAVYQKIPITFSGGSSYNLGTIPVAFAPAAGVINFPAHFKNTYATISVFASGLVQIIPSFANTQYPAGQIVTHLDVCHWPAK